VADTYFVRFRGRTVGPYSLAQAQQMARKGQLARTSEVSCDGQSWSQAGAFPEIFERPATTASVSSKASTISIEPELSPGKAVTFPAFDIPKAPSLNEWYYTAGDEQKGPTSASNIIAMLRAGTLAAHDRVWREGLDNWVSVSDVPDFSAAVGPVLPQPTASRGGSSDEGAFCRECGARINRKAVICTQCGVPQNSEGGELSFSTSGNAPRAAKQAAQGNGLVAAGYVCAVVALLILPPVFALVAFIIGIINLTRNQIGHGIAQIVLSVICGFFGMVIGAALMS
jgi:hypothetical protein